MGGPSNFDSFNMYLDPSRIWSQWFLKLIQNIQWFHVVFLYEQTSSFQKNSLWTQTGLSGQIYLTQEVGKKSKLRKKLPQLDADLCSLFWLPCYRLPVNWVVLFWTGTLRRHSPDRFAAFIFILTLLRVLTYDWGQGAR